MKNQEQRFEKVREHPESFYKIECMISIMMIPLIGFTWLYDIVGILVTGSLIIILNILNYFLTSEVYWRKI